MNDSEKKAMAQQQYAMTALLIITLLNILFGVLMVSKMIPIWAGMFLSFFVVVLVLWKAQRDLLDDGETMWESPKKFHQRNSKS